MTAGELVDSNGREPVWIDPLQSVFDALERMNSENIGALLVQIEGYIVGIVSERDYVRRVILDHRASKLTKVSEIMTREVVTVSPQQTVSDCLDLMKHHNIRHLPVVEAGRVLGMLSLRDLFLKAIEKTHVATTS
ncbi:MAG: CBS domain-containing protein [Gammaproteobacteria bacterium]|nr:CBS domain-containing protein [Gammaproteobacteria bacterium]